MSETIRMMDVVAEGSLFSLSDWGILSAAQYSVACSRLFRYRREGAYCYAVVTTEALPSILGTPDPSPCCNRNLLADPLQQLFSYRPGKGGCNRNIVGSVAPKSTIRDTV